MDGRESSNLKLQKEKCVSNLESLDLATTVFTTNYLLTVKQSNKSKKIMVHPTISARTQNELNHY